jgi:hypothetical protein
MALALALGKNTDILSKLIVADIAPSRGPLSAEFRNYIKAMMHIEAENVKTRKDADTILAQYEPVCPNFLGSRIRLTERTAGHRGPRISTNESDSCQYTIASGAFPCAPADNK